MKGFGTIRPVVLVCLLTAALLAQSKKEQIKVHILDQKESEAEFAISYPGYQQSNCNVYAYGNQGQVNCSSVANPGGQSEYKTKGYAITLLLPDKRIVIATCEKKANWTDWSTTAPYRSCRHPLTNDVDAEFDADHVKLF